MRRDLLPPWLLARPDVETLVEQHGCFFLAAVGFKDNAHLEHYLATGDIRQPASVRAAEKFARDPVRHQRKILADRFYRARRNGDEATMKRHAIDLEIFDLVHAS